MFKYFGMQGQYVVLCDDGRIVFYRCRGGGGEGRLERVGSALIACGLSDADWLRSVSDAVWQWVLLLDEKPTNVEIILPRHRTWMKEMSVVNVRTDRLRQVVVYEVMQNEWVKGGDVLWSVAEYAKNTVQTHLLLTCVKMSLVKGLVEVFIAMNIRISAFHFASRLVAGGVLEEERLCGGEGVRIYVDYCCGCLSLWIWCEGKIYFRSVVIEVDDKNFQARVVFEIERLCVEVRGDCGTVDDVCVEVRLVRPSNEIVNIRQEIEVRLIAKWVEGLEEDEGVCEEVLFDRLLKLGWCRSKEQGRRGGVYLTNLPSAETYVMSSGLRGVMVIAAIWIFGMMLVGGVYMKENMRLRQCLRDVEERLGVVRGELSVNEDWGRLNADRLMQYASIETNIKRRYVWVRFLDALQKIIPLESGVYVEQLSAVSKEVKLGLSDVRYVIQLYVPRDEGCCLEQVFKKFEADLKNVLYITEVLPFKVWVEGDLSLRIQCHIRIMMEGVDVG